MMGQGINDLLSYLGKGVQHRVSYGLGVALRSSVAAVSVMLNSLCCLGKDVH